MQMIEKFFNDNLKGQIMKYCEKLKSISTKYDVLIFMARKSICFYDALVLNGEIDRVDPNVVITTSSRILSYDCKFLEGKRIALLDDIVLKGNTLNDTICFLLEKGIKNFVVYYIASQSIQNGKAQLIKKYLNEPILELSSSEILVLGNAITNYISASACSYNVDYPIFYMDSENGFYQDYIKKNFCSLVPGCNVGNTTNMYVQNFDCAGFFGQYSLPALQRLKERGCEIILKIRIFYRPDAVQRKVVAIPIIVLPELKKQDIKDIFESMTSISIYEMIKSKEIEKETCNMLNVVQYILSYQLFYSVFHGQFNFKYSCENQDYIFPRAYSNEILSCLSKYKKMPISHIKTVVLTDNLFELSRIYGYFFDFIGDLHIKGRDHKKMLSFKDIYAYCEQFCPINALELRGYVSILFDYAIDTGLIVPEVCVRAENVMRSYRLSEQYELHEKQFDLIIYMYNEYQKKTNKSVMNRILVEKLLVLYFQKVITKILNEYNSNHIDEQGAQNLFGITYARFGPVVSDSATKLGVSKDSYLTKRLFDDSRNPYKRLYECGRKKQVYAKESSGDVFANLPEDCKNRTRLFVNRYDYLEKILQHYGVFEKTRFIHTFDQFLIIAAIGNSKDSQLLSLAAEIKIYQDKVSLKNEKSDIVMAINSIMDGVANGIWKYICYEKGEYKTCSAIVANKIESERERLEKLDSQIQILRKNLDTLKQIENSPNDIDISLINTVFKIYRSFYVSIGNKQNYYESIAAYDTVRRNPEQWERYLKSIISELRGQIYETIDQLSRQKDDINQKYIDVDKIEEIFSEQNIESNMNIELAQVAGALMDRIVMILYEIAEEWNYIIKNITSETIGIEISYRDRNRNYLNTIRDIFKENEEFGRRQQKITRAIHDLDCVVMRQRELVYEIDILLFCINQYIMSNTSRFHCIQKFYIIRRDDGNAIEINEILDAKAKEVLLNQYFGFENGNLAALNKSKYSLELIERLNEYTGYTLIDYECTRVCNTIVQTMEQCYSKRVKEIINNILREYTNKRVKITDEE